MAYSLVESTSVKSRLKGNIMKMLLWLTLPLLFSCASRGPSSEDTPAWIDGIKSGKESLKVKNGDKVFYRRILSLKNDSIQKTCDEVLEQVTKDLLNEYALSVKIPFTLDYLHYDPKLEVCAVTISISSSLSARMIEMKKIKEDYTKNQMHLENEWRKALNDRNEAERKNQELSEFIRKNQGLLDQYQNGISAVDRAKASLVNKGQRAISVAYKGLSLSEFEDLMNENIKVEYNFESPCYKRFRYTYVSYHGRNHVCWTSSSRSSATVAMHCDSLSDQCYYKEP